MKEEGFKYYAFISYSHKDKKTAQRLHKRLRSYHLPSKLIKSHPELPKKLGTIFLDEANLVAKEGSLTESLRDYLDDSNYLILICSPDSAKSPYVNDEVEYFMNIGRRNHIVPLIVRGIPRSKDPDAECFVPAILNLPRELEPLGIDIKTYGERDSFLRVIATTLGIDLEYFISVEARERKRKFMIFSSIAAVLALGASVLVWYGMRNKNLYDGSVQFLNALEYYHRKDYARAKELFEKAAANGYANAQYSLGMMYYDGEGVEQDYVKAAGWYQKAASNGQAEAQNNLAMMYEKGEGVEQDYVKAVTWYQKAADNGQVEAQRNLAIMYDKGEGVKQDYAKAIELYQKAAENGSINTQILLGLMYEVGHGVEQDDAKAAEWYQKAADNGHADAQFFLALMYAEGRGVKLNSLKAMELYQKAADKGHALAQYYLGIMYESELLDVRPGKKDYGKAKELFEKAAASSDDFAVKGAQSSLGAIYEYGRGVEQDYMKAAEWYQKAANNDDRFAQLHLGFMYENGLGVEKDIAKAKELYEKAAKNGDSEAQKKLDEMQNKANAKDNH